MMNLMATVFIHLQKGMYTQGTSKKAGFMVLGPKLSLMAPYFIQASGKMQKSMESESRDYIMEAFTEAALKITNSMASVSSGVTKTPSTKEIIKITNEWASS